LYIFNFFYTREGLQRYLFPLITPHKDNHRIVFSLLTETITSSFFRTIVTQNSQNEYLCWKRDFHITRKLAVESITRLNIMGVRESRGSGCKIKKNNKDSLFVRLLWYTDATSVLAHKVLLTTAFTLLFLQQFVTVYVPRIFTLYAGF